MTREDKYKETLIYISEKLEKTPYALSEKDITEIIRKIDLTLKINKE